MKKAPYKNIILKWKDFKREWNRLLQNDDFIQLIKEDNTPFSGFDSELGDILWIYMANELNEMDSGVIKNFG